MSKIILKGAVSLFQNICPKKNPASDAHQGSFALSSQTGCVEWLHSCEGCSISVCYGLGDSIPALGDRIPVWGLHPCVWCLHYCVRWLHSSVR